MANRHFTQLKIRGLWEVILDSVVKIKRISENREGTPSLLAIDSQSVKKIRFINQETGIDGGKIITGRKRTILRSALTLDTQDFSFSVKVTVANISDNQADILAIDLFKEKVLRLEKITADPGYKNTFIEHVTSNYN